MRLGIIAIAGICTVLGMTSRVRADVTLGTCVRVTARTTGDATELRRALASQLTTPPRGCFDVALVGIDVSDDGDDVVLTARVSVMVSKADRISAVVAGRATLRATRRDLRLHRSELEHDAIDRALASVLPSLRGQP